jgi:hypothetical protein
MGLICSRQRPGSQQSQIQSPPPPYDEIGKTQTGRPLTDTTSKLPHIFSWSFDQQSIVTHTQDAVSMNASRAVKVHIKASSTPQWRWTNAQCQDWITLVLTEYSGKEPETARGLADEFLGFGPNLYLMSWKEWHAWLGADGQAIFAILMEVHGEKGAVPSQVEIPHYARGK